MRGAARRVDKGEENRVYALRVTSRAAGNGRQPAIDLALEGERADALGRPPYAVIVEFSADSDRAPGDPDHHPGRPRTPSLRVRRDP
jgi:hypothetical protein